MVEPHLRPQAVDTYIDDLVRPIARARLEAIEDIGAVDIVAEYCEPVSVRALGDLLGLPDVSEDKLREWFHKLSVSFTNADMTPDGEFANPTVSSPATRPGGDHRHARPEDRQMDRRADDSAVSHWLHDGMPEGETRSREVIYPNIYVFLLGAMQEPAHAMATTMAGLFSKPDQFERVVDDPSLLPRAINEGMRWVARSGRPPSRWRPPR